MNWKEGRKVSEDRERPGELALEKQVRACPSWMGPQKWQPVLFSFSGAQRSDGQAQLIQRVGTFCFLISFQCLILGEDTAGERCRDSKRKKETSLEWIPGRRLKSKLDPLYFLLWVVKVVPNPRGKLAWQGVSMDFSSAQMDFGVLNDLVWLSSLPRNYPENVNSSLQFVLRRPSKP